MDYKTYTDKTSADAITAACMDLGVTSDQLDYIVDSEGSAGFFGIGSRSAVIRARIREEEPAAAEEIPVQKAAEETAAENAGPRIKTLDEIEARAKAAAERDAANGVTYEKPERRERPERDRDRRGRRDRRGKRSERGSSYEEIEEKEYTPSKPKPERVVVPRTEEEIAAMKKDAETFLDGVFGAMHMEVKKDIAYDAENGVLNCEFSGDDMGILIGKRGQTLDSLQYLTSLVVNNNQKDYVRVKLDTEEYRKRRKETLETLSNNIAGKVKRTHRAVVLEPMNPYERRIIHACLQGNKFVDTYSEGEEPYRRVVVTPKRNH